MERQIARLPVFNKSMKIFGYQLQYGSTPEGDSQGASETLVNSFQNIGIERVTSGKRAFVPMSAALLLSEVATLIPNRILVVEVAPEVPATEQLVLALSKIRGKGYTVAMGQHVLTPEYAAFLPLADIIKIDFSGTPLDQVDRLGKLLSGKPNKLLACNLEQPEDFETAKEMGFSLFQGQFFCKPTLVMSTEAELSPLKVNCLQLVRLVFEPTVNYNSIQEIIKHDVALSYRLLRVVNSAFFGLRYTVKNIRQALAILGMDEIKKWVTLVSMSELSEQKPEELVRMSLVRARMMEKLAPSAGMMRDADDLFMVGLLSLMDVLMDLSMEDIIARTNISPSIAQPLTTGAGNFGAMLRLAVAWELSDFEAAVAIAASLGIPEDRLSPAYLDATRWADNL